MSLSDRRQVLALLAAAPLAACGFSPVYAPDGAGTALRGRVHVADPDNLNDFNFVAQLETRLGRAITPAYDLTYSISTTRTGGGITLESEITRYTIQGTANFTLTDRATNTRVTGGKVRNFTSFSATGTTVAGDTAEKDANQRLMIMLADQLVTQLISALPAAGPTP